MRFWFFSSCAKKVVYGASFMFKDHIALAQKWNDCARTTKYSKILYKSYHACLKLLLVDAHCISSCCLTPPRRIWSHPVDTFPSAIYTHWPNSPWAFSMLDKPSSLSLSSYERRSRPLIILVAIHWSCSRNSMSPLYQGAQTCTQYSRWGLTQAD